MTLSGEGKRAATIQSGVSTQGSETRRGRRRSGGCRARRAGGDRRRQGQDIDRRSVISVHPLRRGRRYRPSQWHHLGRRGNQRGRWRAWARDRAVRSRCRQAESGKLPPSDRGLYRQEGARDLQRLPVRADPGDGRIRQVQMPVFAGQYAAERDARLQGRSKEVQPGAADRPVGGQLRLDLPALADQDGADRRLETQEPEDPYRRRAGGLLPDHPQGGAAS